MTAVLVRLGSDLRRGWRSWFALALLIGVFSGVVVTAATGARRTATAYPRLVEHSRAEDLLLSPAATGIPSFYKVLAAHPDVEVVGAIGGAALFTSRNGEPEYGTNVFIPVDGRFFHDVDRPLVIEGRVPRADVPTEIFANPLAAERYHLRAGSRLRMIGLAYPGGDSSAEPRSTRLQMTVVGIGVIPADIVATTKLDGQPRFVTSPAFLAEYVPGTVSMTYDGAAVRVKPGVSPVAFRATAQQLASGFEEVGPELFVGEQTDRTRKVNDAVRPQAFALGGFAAFAGLAGLFVLGQALVRQLVLDAAEVPILRTLGLTRLQLTGLGVARAGLVALAAALVAVGTAIALSPLTPIGVARPAEVHPGVEVNVAWLAAGAVVVFVLFTARAVVPSWRLANVRAGLHGTAELAGSTRPSALARAAGQTSLPPSAAAGIRMALEPGRGRSAVPVRAALAGALIGLAAVATALTFAVSLERLVSTPRLYGRTWDIVTDGQFAALPRAPVERTLRASTIVDGSTGGYYGEATVAGRGVTAIGLENGDVGPSLVEGRPPRRDDEVVLGTSTLRRAGGRVGDTVALTVGKDSRRMSVVGRAVFPGLGRGGFPQTGLGEGVWTTARALQPPPDPQAGGKPYYNFWLVRSRASATDAQRHALEARLAQVCGLDCLQPREAVTLQQPAEVATLDRVRWTPVVLAAVLAGLALATVGQTLVSSIRRRRRELALLKTLGFLRSQVSATVAWQATTIASVAAVIGLPIGVMIGRLLWRGLGTQLGIVPEPATPALPLVIALPATVLLANLIAVLPGALAARARPALALRAE
ncbi:MAG: putative transport system permease protein [Actinomycetota bacterium]